jgi:PAS domain S-box-containing protein
MIKVSNRTHKSLPRSKKTEEPILYRHFLDNVHEAVAAFGENENIIYVNPAFCKLTGFSEKECFSKKSIDLFRGTDLLTVKNELKKRAKGISSQYEANITTVIGKKIPVLISASALENSRSVAIFTDLREVKKREQRISKLRKHEKHLVAILKNSADAIISLDLCYKVLSWNEGAERLFGYSEKEMLGKSIDLLIPSERKQAGELDRLRAQANAQGYVKNFETVRFNKNGKEIPLSISQTAIRNNGEISGYSLIYRDISVQKHWEAELQNRFDKIQDAYREMGRQRRYIDYLEELIDIAFEKNSFSDVLNYIANAFLIIGQADIVTLHLLNEKKKNALELVALNGGGKEFWSRKFLPYENSLFEKAFKKMHPIHVTDTQTALDFPLLNIALKHEVRSLYILPLICGDEFIGGVTLFAKNGNMHQIDNEFVNIFAKQVTAVIKLLILKRKKN